MKTEFFLTGTDTEVGKTHITCALLRATQRLGLTAIGMKPIAAGVDAEGRNSDVTQLLVASSAQPPLAWVNPFLYTPAIAPHIAAREANRPIDLATIRQALDKLRALADVIWVEGVGGFRVPLDEDHDTADLAESLGLPVILVVGMRLGCLNHALLTAEAITRRKLHLAGWIANRIDPTMERVDANLASLQRRLAAPLIGVAPYGDALDLASAALQLSVLPDFAAVAQ